MLFLQIFASKNWPCWILFIDINAFVNFPSLTFCYFRMGLKPTEIADGYERALDKALEVLETLSVCEVKNSKDVTEVTKAIR